MMTQNNQYNGARSNTGTSSKPAAGNVSGVVPATEIHTVQQYCTVCNGRGITKRDDLSVIGHHPASQDE